MTTNENNLVQATKDTLIIDTENPRFKGMQVNPMDPVPYGDAINRMYDSMIATHKSMGSLLLQPVVATINNNGMLLSVRAILALLLSLPATMTSVVS